MSHLLTFPDDDNQIGQWIESLLVSPDFAFTVSQLSKFGAAELQDEAEPIDPEVSVEAARTGLSNLSVKQCRWLLRNPDQLSQLNEKIFEFGSPYWMGKLETSPMDAVLFQQVADSISGGSHPPTAREVRSDRLNDSKRISESESRRSFLHSTSSKLLAVAATLLFCFLGLTAYQTIIGGSVEPWGWQSHEFAQTETSDQYLNALDQSLMQWYDQSKGSGELLATRLDQFSQGCQRVIDATHEGLSQSDKDWLLEKCNAWKKKIDDLAIAARSSSERQDVEKIKSDADDLVAKISLAFKDRIRESTS